MDAAMADTGTTKGVESAVMAASSRNVPPVSGIDAVARTATTHLPMDAAMANTRTTEGAESAVMAASSRNVPPMSVIDAVAHIGTIH